MKRYLVQSYGYTNCPQFNSYDEAKQCLNEIVADEMKACKRRFGKAVKRVLGKDNYEITLAGRHSPLWSAHFICEI